jgi:glycosyltransferase involved in cell wall biosynthesis
MANQTRQLASLLAAAGAVVALVQTNRPYRPQWVGHIPVLRAAFRLVPYVLQLWRAAGCADVFHVMANSGWSWHLFAAPAVWIGRARRVPVVVNYRGGEAADFLRSSGTSVRWTMKRCGALIVPSGFLQEVFARYAMRAEVIPNVLNLQRFRPAERFSSDGPRMLVARNLEAIYDIATALRAFRIVLDRHPGAELFIAGTGPEEGRLRELAEQLGVERNVRFTGRLEPDEVAALLRECHVALNPSRVDNSPNSVLEALASGVPVVSARVGGVPYIVEHEESALLVPPGDPAAMGAAVLRLLDDAVLAERLRSAGLGLVGRYGWDSVGPLLAETYRRAIVVASA